MRKSTPVLTKKDGEPSIHLKQKVVFTSAIIAGVILVFVFGLVSSRKCKPCDTSTPSPSKPESKSSDFNLGKAPQKRGGLEFQLSESSIGRPLTQEEIQKRLRMTKESQSGQAIQKVFREKVAKPLKEKFMATPKRIWKAPPGVQPGTLVVPPIGYKRVGSNVDRNPMEQPLPAAVYVYEPDQKYVTTTYVNPDGSTFTGPQYNQNDTYINGMMPPYKKENQRGERAIVEERGTTDHSFSSSNNLEDGITGETWEGKRQDWNKSKDETKEALMKISDMFDSLLNDTIFTDLKRMEVGDGWFKVKSGADCISIERYYEWVASSIAAQMGTDPVYSLDWAKGSNIKLGFEFIDQSVPDLRQGLRFPCDMAPSYKIREDGVYISSQTKEELAYSVIWPKDNSVLYVHRAKKK